MITEEPAGFNYEAVEAVSFSIHYQKPDGLMGSCTAPADTAKRWTLTNGSRHEDR